MPATPMQTPGPRPAVISRHRDMFGPCPSPQLLRQRPEATVELRDVGPCVVGEETQAGASTPTLPERQAEPHTGERVHQLESFGVVAEPDRSESEVGDELLNVIATRFVGTRPGQVAPLIAEQRLRHLLPTGRGERAKDRRTRSAEGV